MPTADPTNPAIKKVPYIGVQVVGIPSFNLSGCRLAKGFVASI
jgi:hypothetical protein